MKKTIFILLIVGLKASAENHDPRKPITDTLLSNKDLKISVKYNKKAWKIEPMNKQDSLAAIRIWGMGNF